MTVETQLQKVVSNGNDSTTSFPFSFVITSEDDLSVVVTDSNGVETTISKGTGTSNYSVTVASYPGSGSITYPATLGTALATGSTITVKRLLTIEQMTDLTNKGEYNPETQERQFDKFIMIDLQQQEELDRAIKVPVSYTGSASFDFPTPSALAMVRWNSAATALENVQVSTLTNTLSVSDPADNGKVLQANSGTFDFQTLTMSDISDAGTSATKDTGTSVGNVVEVQSGGALPALDGSALTGLSSGDSFPTGVVMPYVGSTAPSGWLLFNGDTIGSAASAATQNSDSNESLFTLIYDSMTDSEAPVSGGRGANAAADWAANKTITMPDPNRRAVIGTGTETHGDTGGSADAIVVAHTHDPGTLAAASGGAHTHTITFPSASYIASGGGSLGAGVASDSSQAFPSGTNSGGSHTHTISGATASTGSSATDANLPPWLALRFIIKQ